MDPKAPSSLRPSIRPILGVLFTAYQLEHDRKLLSPPREPEGEEETSQIPPESLCPPLSFALFLLLQINGTRLDLR